MKWRGGEREEGRKRRGRLGRRERKRGGREGEGKGERGREGEGDGERGGRERKIPFSLAY